MDQGWLTDQFEENRLRLRGVAYRMLGSLSEAEDAVQEAWLRLNRSDPATIENQAAAKQLASRARRRVRGAPSADTGRTRQREVVLRGASTWAAPMISISRGRLARGVRFQPAVINGAVGVIVAPRGKLSQAIVFSFKDDKVTRIEAVADPARLRALEVAVL